MRAEIHHPATGRPARRLMLDRAEYHRVGRSGTPPGSVTRSLAQGRSRHACSCCAYPGGGCQHAGELCVPRTSSVSCDQAVFVDQATAASLFSDAVLVEIDRLG